MNKVKILHILPTRDMEYGGPIAVAEELSKEMNLQGVKSTIYPFIKKDKSELNFIRKLANIRSEVKKSDLVHIHCLWNFNATIAAYEARRCRIPYLITPHGMLDKWSISRSYWKKKIFMLFFERRNLLKASGVHFLNDEELAESKILNINFKSFVLPNGISKNWSEDVSLFGINSLKLPDLKGRVVILFLGRVHPKKGVDVLLLALSKIINSVPQPHLIIAGPCQSKYKTQLISIIDKNNLSEFVTFTGMVENENKAYLFNVADIFVLHSHQ
jgi:glycosyltransferase involved in cell wall biosynthesis